LRVHLRRLATPDGSTSLSQESLHFPLYARISSGSDGTAIGMAHQLADCEATAERLDWTVADGLPGQRRVRLLGPAAARG